MWETACYRETVKTLRGTWRRTFYVRFECSGKKKYENFGKWQIHFRQNSGRDDTSSPTINLKPEPNCTFLPSADSSEITEWGKGVGLTN